MLLTISHTWHLLICHISSLDACQITIVLPFISKVFPISTIYSSPHLDSPSRLNLSLLLQHLISHWDRGHSAFSFSPYFLVSTRSHSYISLFSVFVSCPSVFTDPFWAQKCCTQTLGSSTTKSSFYWSAWCVKQFQVLKLHIKCKLQQ